MSGRKQASGDRIDAHLHLWDLQVSDYAWLGPQHGALFNTFTAEQAKQELDGAGIDRAILVQAEDSRADTEFMLRVAEQNPWVAGVVGWVELDKPVAAEGDLERWLRHPVICGVRHLVHDDPRDDFLALAEVRRSLSMVADAGLAFDVPDAWPRHLSAVADLADALPELTIVVDHLAKPPLGRPDFAAWQTELARVAELPNTVAKFSGLRTPGVDFTVEAIRPVLHTVLELFGANRLMYGGDWPMTITAGGYQPTWQVMRELIEELSADEQGEILSGCAARAYSLGKRFT